MNDPARKRSKSSFSVHRASGNEPKSNDIIEELLGDGEALREPPTASQQLSLRNVKDNVRNLKAEYRQRPDEETRLEAKNLIKSCREYRALWADRKHYFTGMVGAPKDIANESIRRKESQDATTDGRRVQFSKTSKVTGHPYDEIYVYRKGDTDESASNQLLTGLKTVTKPPRYPYGDEKHKQPGAGGKRRKSKEAVIIEVEERGHIKRICVTVKPKPSERDGVEE